MAVGSGGTSYSIEGADVLLRKIQGLSPELRKMANRELRAAARVIAKDASNRIRVSGKATGAAQADDVAQTARPKSDRLPVVRIPGVKVPVRGIKRGGKGASQAVARGATGGGRAKQFAGTRNWVFDLRPELAEVGVEKYNAAMDGMLSRWGLI